MKKLLPGIFILASLSALADSEKISLNSGITWQIPNNPGPAMSATIHIPSYKLVQNSLYNVHCNIINPEKPSLKLSIRSHANHNNANILIDDENSSDGYWFIHHGSSNFEAKNILFRYTDISITFSIYDKGALIITNCYAEKVK